MSKLEGLYDFLDKINVIKSIYEIIYSVNKAKESNDDLLRACEDYNENPTSENAKKVRDAWDKSTKDNMGAGLNAMAFGLDPVRSETLDKLLITNLIDKINKRNEKLNEVINQSGIKKDTLEKSLCYDQLNGISTGQGGDIANPAQEGSNNANRTRRIDPLILDLDGDGLEFINLNTSKAKFDLTGDGFATHTSWVSKDDGLLALDKNNDNKINDIDELFGSESVTGFEELAELDTNQDGKINVQDERFNDLLVWQDLNEDGQSTVDEIKSLSDFNITEISLDRKDVNTEVNDVVQDKIGHYLTVDKNGNQAKHLLADVLFTTRPTFSQFVGDVVLTSAAKKVGKLKGYGMMPDLDIAMSLDTELASQVLAATEGLTSANLTERFENVLFSWANANSLTTKDLDRTPNLTADEHGIVHFNRAGVSLSLKQLGVLKAYTGIDNLELNDGEWNDNGQRKHTGKLYQQAWNNISQNLMIKFAVSQGLLEDLFPLLSYTPQTDQLRVPYDFAVNAEKLLDAAVTHLGPLDTAEKTTSLMLLFTTYTQFDSEFTVTHRSKLIEILRGTCAGGHQWLSDNTNQVERLLPNVIFGSAVMGSSGNKFIFGSDGNDTLHASNGNDTLEGLEGNDTLHGGDGSNTLEGGKGNDALIVSGWGNNNLNGGAGEDTLKVERRDDYRYQRDYGRKANNVLTGGQGNDRLEGGAGTETYHFSRGDGQDTINDYDQHKFGRTDRIVLGEGIIREELSIVRKGNHMVLLIGGAESGDSITIENAYTDEKYRIERMVLADGTTLYGPTFGLPISILGTDQDDALQGTGFNETVIGNQGNDTLHGGDGNNMLEGGKGNDALIVSGWGNNNLNGGAGEDTLKVERRDDYRYQRDYGRTASNVLTGGQGNDRLEGGAGTETYHFSRGDGQDTINDYDQHKFGRTDRIVLGEGIIREELSIVRKGNHMVLLIGGAESGDSITIENAYTDEKYRIERMVLADGTTLYGPTFGLPISILGTDQDDALQGTGFNETVIGNQGNDTLHGGDGNNTLEGGKGNDALIVSGWGNNNLNGGAGEDTLKVERRDDYRYQRDYGRKASNVLTGGQGNDRLEGGAGTETYHFSRGDGQDTINDYDQHKFGRTDRIVLGEGIIREELSIVRKGNHMVLLIGGAESGDSITIENAYTDEKYRIERMVLADGTILYGPTFGLPISILGTDQDDALQGTGFNETVIGNQGNDTLHGGDGNNTLEGGKGNDALIVSGWGNNNLNGGAGEDTLKVERRDDYRYQRDYGRKASNVLTGGQGNDRLEGGAGTETYHFSRGDGQDTINDYDQHKFGRTDRIVLGEGIIREELSIVRKGNHMVLLIGGAESGDSITIENAYTDEKYRIERMVLADGTTLYGPTFGLPISILGTDQDDALQGTGFNETVIGNQGNDTLHGGDGNNTLEGGKGNDALIVSGWGNNNLNGGAGEDTLKVERRDDYRYQRDYGRKASNVLTGGQGNDRLEGGAGTETYHFSRGDGQDTINDYDQHKFGRTDRIVLGEGIIREELSIVRKGNHMVLLIGGAESGDSITIENAYTDEKYRIERMVLADGTTLYGPTFGLPISILGTDQDDALQGTGFNETVIGNQGNDTLHGGDGNNTLEGGKGRDVLIVSGWGNNNLNGGAGEDTLKVERRDDYRYQRDYGRKANNVLTGGQGNDRLEGGAGTETYHFSRGDGQDTINDYDQHKFGRTDRIVLGEGIAKDDLSIVRKGNHVVLLIDGSESGDSITIENAYTDERYRVEQIVLADGTQLQLDTLPECQVQVASNVNSTDTLIQAMSSFAGMESSLGADSVIIAKPDIMLISGGEYHLTK